MLGNRQKLNTKLFLVFREAFKSSTTGYTLPTSLLQSLIYNEKTLPKHLAIINDNMLMCE